MPSAAPSKLYAIPRIPVRTTDEAIDDSHSHKTLEADNSSANEISRRGAGLVISRFCLGCHARQETPEDPQQCAARFGRPTALEPDAGVRWPSQELDESWRAQL